MNKYLFLFATIILFCAILFAEQKVHLVVKGDTLWDIAGKYYNNPWAWRKIYEANKEIIKDPHWIFPEQQLVIVEITEQVVSEVAAKPETSPVTTEPLSEETTCEIEQPVTEELKVELQEETKQEEILEEAKPEKPQKIIEYHSRSLSVPLDYKFDGKIIGSEKGQLFILQSDLVYLDIGFQHGITKDTKCYVLRKIGPIRDRQTGERIGYRVAKLGILQLTEEITEKTSTAIVYRSYEPIARGDYVKIIK